MVAVVDCQIHLTRRERTERCRLKSAIATVHTKGGGPRGSPCASSIGLLRFRTGGFYAKDRASQMTAHPGTRYGAETPQEAFPGKVFDTTITYFRPCCTTTSYTRNLSTPEKHIDRDTIAPTHR